MLDRLFSNCMLRPADLKPRYPGMKIIGTFNPGAIQLSDGSVALLVRVCEAPIEKRKGFHCSPRMDPQQGLVIDWLPEEEHDSSDPRVLRHRARGEHRLRFISYLRVFFSRDGKTIDNHNGPVIEPTSEYETYGLEDPRITRLGDTFHITVVTVSKHGVATSLMSTTDFRDFRGHGIIFAPDNKDVVIFPEKVAGRYIALHRPVPAMRFVPPEMWIARSDDLLHWGEHRQLLGSGSGWQNNRVGGGTPPIATEAGFLALYHAAHKAHDQPGVGIYCGGALLLAGDDPSRVAACTEGPIMRPQTNFETQGFAPNVVFPTAMIERDDELWVYYGAADENVGVTAFKRADVLAALDR
ncbi:MAG: glycosylase [Phycisphaeraceae bacterium]|nr:glycosylase [Phycisphaeraceae bacterium]